MVSIRPAKAGDYEAIYGEPLKHSIRAYTAEIDGKPVGIAGVAYVGGQVSAFSKGLPGIPKHWAARGTVVVKKMLREMNCPVLAIADPEIPTSSDFLKRVGFEHVTTNSQGEVFRWIKQP